MAQLSRPETISRFKKERFLLSMPEDNFRDEVIRPLFLRRGLKDGRDVCGPFEKGKDAIFLSTNKLGIEEVYVIQTKKGNINLSRKVQTNLIEAITQLRTACETKVTFIQTKKKELPSKVILCASGRLNDSAQHHIVDEIHDPRLMFLDSNDLIPMIDDIFPELWLGIDAEITPYFRQIKKIIEESDEIMAISEILPMNEHFRVAADQGFVMLRLHRAVLRPKKVKGRIIQVPHFEEIPVIGVLNKRQRLILILGEAGSGKSTCIKRFTYILAKKGLEMDSKENLRIPIFLRALDVWNRNTCSLVEICAAETKRITNSLKASFSAEDLLRGRVVVFIDALDELADDQARTSVLQLAEEFHNNYPDCLIVVTSREYAFVGHLEALTRFDIYRLSPINYRQAEQIVNRLQRGQNLPTEKSQELLRRLEQVHGMQLNPLLVTVFAATSEYSRQDIPANITELFKKFTEMMLGRWDASKGLRQQYQAPLKDFILQKIAFEMHKEGLTSIHVNRFNRILETELANRGLSADFPQLQEEVLNRSGLFITANNAIEFRHLLIQEFFAGRGIPSVEYLQTIVTNEWWRRAVVFYFGENPGDSKALYSTITGIQTRPVNESYEAALTLGLGLQACYLVELKDKIDIYCWVIRGLASAKEEFLNDADPQSKFPLTGFLHYYLFGRDSVAFSFLEQRVDEIVVKSSGSDLGRDEKDIRAFWIIVGLIESGSMSEVERLVKKFHPSDNRLLLGIHLGCFLTQHLRVTTKQEKEIAQGICERLSEHVRGLRTQLLEELKTELFEIRQGAVKAINPPPPSPS